MLIGDLRAEARSRTGRLWPGRSTSGRTWRPVRARTSSAATARRGCRSAALSSGPGDRLVLVDAGLGPDRQELPHDMHLVGGQLLAGLRALGVTPVDITDVVCTHLHADHVGWLFGLDAQPVFGRAAIWAGEADWRHFVTGPGEMLPHIRTGWRAAADTDRFRPLDRDTAIAPGVTAVLAPGHTPGHLCVVLSGLRGATGPAAVGDAITCPVQLDEPAWHCAGRRRVRSLWRAGDVDQGARCGGSTTRRPLGSGAGDRISPEVSGSAGSSAERPGAGILSELSRATDGPGSSAGERPRARADRQRQSRSYRVGGQPAAGHAFQRRHPRAGRRGALAARPGYFRLRSPG